MLDERFKLKCELMATLMAGTWKSDGRENSYFELDLIRALQAATDIMSMAEKPEPKAEKKPEPQRPSREEKLAGSFINIQTLGTDGLPLEEVAIPMRAYKLLVKEGVSKLADRLCKHFPESVSSLSVRSAQEALQQQQLGL
jgi:hypothetical protein